MSKIEFYTCENCGCVCDSNTLKETVTILGREFYFCHDCFLESPLYEFYKKMVKENKAPEIFWQLINLPINNGWNGKKTYLKITITKEK